MRQVNQDTIVALATPPGESAIGIVRLSGPRAISIGGWCFRGSRRLEELEDRRLTLGRFVVGDQDLDQILVSVMRGPGTYTGEDVVEFNCHGGPLVVRRAVEALVRSGARLADRGEFTKRAFLNGRLDLTQAEAVADMVRARADAGLQSAFFQLRGGLRKQFGAMADRLRDVLALLEAGLDFPEDVDLDHRAALVELDEVLGVVRDLVASYRYGKVIREGAVVTLAGRPNVGKSSLMNRLLGEARAIVTPVPGTTRDTIEESIDLAGIRMVLVDTAGMRESGDPVEQAGTARSQRAVDRSQLVLFVVDGSQPPELEDLSLIRGMEGRRALLVLNKLDLGMSRLWEAGAAGWPRVAVSALSGEGVDGLRSAMRDAVFGAEDAQCEVLTQERHVDALRRTEAALCEARDALALLLPAEITAMEIRSALDAIGSIVGETTSEQVLDRIFQVFCIGK